MYTLVSSSGERMALNSLAEVVAELFFGETVVYGPWMWRLIPDPRRYLEELAEDPASLATVHPEIPRLAQQRDAQILQVRSNGVDWIGYYDQPERPDFETWFCGWLGTQGYRLMRTS